MQKKFFLLGFVAAITMLLGVTAWSSTRSAHADPVNECNKASSSCGDRKADAVIINDSNATLGIGDPVQTIVKTGLGASPTLNTNHSINGSFYTAINTQITGLAATGAVPVGNTVGSGNFNLKLAGSLPCNSTGGQLGSGGIPT
ncbi:MAG TPA: hypothetical protein VFW96_20995, partial [Thermomicrobiales bacterium]|nr:hypothetical protein [Thermomicrobiales bacterium]